MFACSDVIKAGLISCVCFCIFLLYRSLEVFPCGRGNRRSSWNPFWHSLFVLHWTWGICSDIMSVCRTCSTKSNDARVNTRVLVQKDISQFSAKQRQRIIFTAWHHVCMMLCSKLCSKLCTIAEDTGVYTYGYEHVSTLTGDLVDNTLVELTGETLQLTMKSHDLVSGDTGLDVCCTHPIPSPNTNRLQ